ncbi:hypothetical protein CPB84DRAFT_1844704 [Gymnopilus junonius]|uniref:Protein kinase domain-containing protein n=1 Tax=Gymnopilus junonius TaxID=109634 RepID=A0A9P5NV05_GYMJU|nr:hypothetical protein CPB84DRAFT_1844704 [Gymnopilus junonius]
MSLQDLLGLAPVPGLATGVNILTSTFKEVQNVKTFIKELSARCIRLMIALRDSSKGLEGTHMIEIADEIEVIVSHVDRKVREWATWTQLKSFLQQGEIKEGIDRLHRDIDASMMKFHATTMELSRGQLESRATHDRDKAEMRELLRMIVKNTDNMKDLLNMQSSRDSNPVEEMMESLQTELMDPSIQASEEEAFKAGLWMLHEETSRLPPLANLTGQVTLLSRDTIRKGSFNDIYLGLWLDQESVALRFPRTLVNNAEVQQRFQREVSIWRELKHPNVVPLYGVVYIAEDLYTVSPWMDNGTVVDYVKKSPSADRMKLLTDAASGLEYLHKKGIVHGDLRGASPGVFVLVNLLVSKDGVVRLSDFGLSKFLEDCGKGIVTSDDINPRWFAPELIKQSGPVSTHSDIWSFAMVCLEILSGQMPYSNITRDIAVLREVDNGKLPQRPGRLATSQGLTDDMWAFMITCWQDKPDIRPSILDVKTRLLELRGVISPLGRSTSMAGHNKGPVFSRTNNQFSIAMARVNSRPSTATSDMSTVSSILETKSELMRHDVQAGHGHQWRPGESNPSAELGSVNSTSLDSLPITSFSGERPVHIVHHSLLEIPPSPPSSFSTRSVLHFRLETEARSYEKVATDSTRSFSSTTSGHLTGPIKEAVLDSRMIVNVVNGVVTSGTLEGLVDRLITNFNLRGDLDYREISDVASSWLSCTGLSNDRQMQVDYKLLTQMKLFCESAIQMKNSTTMVDKAKDILWQVEERARTDNLSSVIPLLPCRRLFADIGHQALRLGDCPYPPRRRQIQGFGCPDYIAHLKRHPGYNNVEGMPKLRNFSSLVAIATTLHSVTVERLRATRAELTVQMQGKLDALQDIIDPSSNHRSYRAALNEATNPDERQHCIPWLAIHLKELNLVFQR